MSWQAEIDEIHQRRRWAEDLGGPEAVDAQHRAGRMTICERIDRLLDAASFNELAKLTGQGTYAPNNAIRKVVPAPYVIGLGKIDGRDVAVGGEDFTIRGGASWGADRRKGGQGGLIEDLAFQYRIPLINLIHGAGAALPPSSGAGTRCFPACTVLNARSNCSG